jgi:restriction system protein
MIPNSQSIMLHYLKLLADSKERSFQDIIENLANTLKISNEERIELIPSGQRTFDYRVGFSRTCFKKAGLVESTKHGFVRITQKGLNVLNKNPDTIDLKFLSQFAEFNDHEAKNLENAIIYPGTKTKHTSIQEFIKVKKSDLILSTFKL